MLDFRSAVLGQEGNEQVGPFSRSQVPLLFHFLQNGYPLLRRATPASTLWQASTDGEVRWYACQVDLPQGQERWVIVSSKASEQRVHTTLQRQVEREQKSWQKRLWHLQAKRFVCEADARTALEENLTQLPAWFAHPAELSCLQTGEGKGCPTKQAVPTQRWQCQTTLSL
jgi:hypothetical protein